MPCGLFSDFDNIQDCLTLNHILVSLCYLGMFWLFNSQQRGLLLPSTTSLQPKMSVSIYHPTAPHDFQHTDDEQVQHRTLPRGRGLASYLFGTCRDRNDTTFTQHVERQHKSELRT